MGPVNPELDLLTYNDVDSTSLQEIAMVDDYIIVMQGSNLLEGSMKCKFKELEDPMDGGDCFIFTEETSEKITGQTRVAVDSGTLTQISIGNTVIWPK